MAVILDFQRHTFGAQDVAVLRNALSAFDYPGNWRGWNEEIASTGDCDAIEIVDPNDWEPLTFTRTWQGGYCAKDADGHVVSTAPNFSQLLESLDINPS